VRPLLIEAEGFSAYRARVSVDLTDLSESEIAFFSLTGPTGAGKSSLIDAMIFALYGRIPRLGARAVAPVITAGELRARVRFDFEVDGARYTAVRLVQRTPAGGATVKEARLQMGEQVLCDGAANLTKAVEDLLKLDFNDFTRTVVLPQGEFARFLNATPAERQNLLRSLLGLDLYSKVRHFATNRQSGAEAVTANATARLEAIAIPEEERLEDLEGRVALLEALAPVIEQMEDRLAAAEKEREIAEAGLSQVLEQLKRLEAIDPPERLEEVGGLLAEATEELGEAEDAEEAAAAEVKEIGARISDLPGADVIAITKRNHQELQRVEAELTSLPLEVVEEKLATAGAELEAARAEQSEAQADLETLHVSHAAHTIGATLVVGQPCPVCLHDVERLPEHHAPAELAHGRKALKTAEGRVKAAEAVLSAARDAVTAVETKRSDLGSKREELVDLLTGAPPIDDVLAQEGHLARLGSELAEAKKRHEAAATACKEARKRHEGLADDQKQMGRLLRTAQQSVASLEPPISESDDVVVEWKELLAWRDETLVRLGEELTGMEQRLTAAAEAVEAARRSIVEELAAAGVEAEHGFRVALATETERARHAVTRHLEALAEIKRLKAEIESNTRTAAVAKSLAGHLRSSGFEQWLMAGALEALVTGANGLLAELSDNGYSLHSEEGDFSIIDHRNADERRPVDTLSGGETFLVSLALALSLAEAHASEGDARLDAVILDEGFGTLDEETLDTVASVLEELARARGVMVGVITHVKELAARATARFEVIRTAEGSTVQGPA
jgi:exonuclease SbcC